MRFMFFAARVRRNTPLRERFESTTDFKTSIPTFKGIWFLTGYKERIASAILLKLSTGDFQRQGLNQFVLPDNNK